MELALLCWEFFKTGLFAVGGGMATIPFLTQMSENYPHWFSLPMLADMIAVSESTPGPIGINMATYVGYTVAGIPGSLAATFSLMLPSFVLLNLIAGALHKYSNNNYVKSGFVGLRPAVTGLIAAAGFAVMGLTFYSDGKINITSVILFILLLICTQVKKLKDLHPVIYIGVAAAVGIVFSL